MFWNKPLVADVANETSFPFTERESIKSRVMKIAVKREVAIPINKVVANPLIGPVPNTNKIKAVRPVVMFASKIEDNALSKPSATAFNCPFPFFSSSRIRSKISTLASTEIPIVNTIPAIPGKVNTAPRPASIPKMSKMFNTKATSAKIPEDP